MFQGDRRLNLAATYARGYNRQQIFILQIASADMIRRPFQKTFSSLTIVLTAFLLQCSYNGETPRAVILVSIDGLHPNYLDTLYTPNLREIAANGVHADYMEPVFPSKTFPNHYSLITGLYPANHGIVNNSMYDPDLGLFFVSATEKPSQTIDGGKENRFGLPCRNRTVPAQPIFGPAPRHLFRDSDQLIGWSTMLLYHTRHV